MSVRPSWANPRTAAALVMMGMVLLVLLVWQGATRARATHHDECAHQVTAAEKRADDAEAQWEWVESVLASERATGAASEEFLSREFYAHTEYDEASAALVAVRARCAR